MRNSPGLPETLSFSQSSLQDFADCPRRFYLKYVRQLRFPAPESEPMRDFEAYMQRGAQFHHLVHQHQIGIPPKVLAATISDDQIAAWWENYLASGLTDLPPRRHPEITLTVPLAGRRLVARYDLLAFGERAVIVDWKTSFVRPSRERLQRRLQTIVYPYVLARAGAYLNGGQPIAPEAISLIYWFAEHPQQPEIFAYSADQFAADGAHLESLAADILRRGDDDFELTDDLERCLYCAFRSLNQRGAKAGDALAAEQDAERDDFALDLSPEQIAEAGF